MKLYNSLSQKLEEFKPLHKKKVTIYVCGITPYDTTHLGHAFTYISFDALIRYLKFTGFNVIYTQNVTDINDRDHDILDRAREQHLSWQKLANFWTKKFLQDMKVLNWTPPTHYLYASKQIASMIQIMKALIQNKLAYLVNCSVYLDISKFPDFGKLSKFKRSKMLKIAKEFEEDLDNPDKKDPLDITLWRGATINQPKHIPTFPSPFGPGRPGWHIECSAMSMSTLGEQIDIHGGGKDLIFPHHEAEIAQSEGASGKIPFAKYWLHTGQVLYRGEKMSKSKGNLVMISNLLKKYSSNAIRWLLLSNHWQKDWEYKEEDLQIAQRNVDLIQTVTSSSVIARNPERSRRMTWQSSEILDNNLDTPKALELLLKLARQNAEELKTFYKVLGFTL